MLARELEQAGEYAEALKQDALRELGEMFDVDEQLFTAIDQSGFGQEVYPIREEG